MYKIAQPGSGGEGSHTVISHTLQPKLFPVYRFLQSSAGDDTQRREDWDGTLGSMEVASPPWATQGYSQG